MTRSLGLCLLLVPACFSTVCGAESAGNDDLQKIRQYLPPLAHSLGDRLPILTWQSRDFPTGLQEGRVAEVQQTLIDRGLSPLCNPVASAKGATAYLPVLKYRQAHGFPVCILPQGWLQIQFVSDRRGKYKAPHQPPATASEEFPCPAALRDARKIERGAAQTTDVLQVLSSHGVNVSVLLVDFESGAYLRNSSDQEDVVRAQAAIAEKCPRCVEQFTRQALSTPSGYAKVVDESRAFAIRNMLCKPAREVFPNVRVGNYYAWPINRLPQPEGRWPAYGFEESGMDIAMPRVYMNAGWGGAGRDQDKMNWNAFYCCLEGFSPAASVLREGELLIPWVHVWLGGRYVDYVMRGRKLPDPWALREMACHMMLRNAETFAVWMDDPKMFPADYPYPTYAAMGQYVYDVKGVQEGFGEMLQFNEFLRRAKPMTFDVPGQRGELGPQTATWSGMIADDKALVRTVSFNNGKPVAKQLKVFDRLVTLTFGPRGRNFWITPDGKVLPADRSTEK